MNKENDKLKISILIYYIIKFQIFWEGRKNWKTTPALFLFLNICKFKKVGRFILTFVAFSEYLNFKMIGEKTYGFSLA